MLRIGVLRGKERRPKAAYASPFQGEGAHRARSAALSAARLGKTLVEVLRR